MPEHESYRVVVSKRAAQQLVEHAAFAARLDEKLAHKLVSGFRQAAVSLERFPFRNPVLRSEVFTVEKYRKLIFDKYHILLYQVKDQVVYVEYVIDGRQDYQWLSLDLYKIGFRHRGFLVMLAMHFLETLYRENHVAPNYPAKTF